MRGQIIIERETGVRWVYIPAEHIQLRVCQGGTYGLIIFSLRTDNFIRTKRGLVPTEEWLKRTCQFTSEVDVPDEVVKFAVLSEQERQRTVSNIAQETEAVVERGGSFLGEFLQRALEEEENDAKDFLEYHYATQIQEFFGIARDPRQLLPFSHSGRRRSHDH